MASRIGYRFSKQSSKLTQDSSRSSYSSSEKSRLVNGISQSRISHNQQSEITLKIILLGNNRCGKTTLLHRYVTGRYNPLMTSRNDLGMQDKRVFVDSRTVILKMSDTAGQERFRSLTSSFYRGVHGCLLVYDVTDLSSFDSLTYWIKEIGRYMSNTDNMVLVGSKCDVAPRQVPATRAKRLAEYLKIPHIEVSSESGLHVDDVFDILVERILESTKPSNPNVEMHKSLVLDSDTTKRTRIWWCCCCCYCAT